MFLKESTFSKGQLGRISMLLLVFFLQYQLSSHCELGKRPLIIKVIGIRDTVRYHAKMEEK
jgi:hypothetical protein